MNDEKRLRSPAFFQKTTKALPRSVTSQKMLARFEAFWASVNHINLNFSFRTVGTCANFIFWQNHLQHPPAQYIVIVIRFQAKHTMCKADEKVARKIVNRISIFSWLRNHYLQMWTILRNFVEAVTLENYKDKTTSLFCKIYCLITTKSTMWTNREPCSRTT